MTFTNLGLAYRDRYIINDNTFSSHLNHAAVEPILIDLRLNFNNLRPDAFAANSTLDFNLRHTISNEDFDLSFNALKSMDSPTDIDSIFTPYSPTNLERNDPSPSSTDTDSSLINAFSRGDDDPFIINFNVDKTFPHNLYPIDDTENDRFNLTNFMGNNFVQSSTQANLTSINSNELNTLNQHSQNTDSTKSLKPKKNNKRKLSTENFYSVKKRKTVNKLTSTMTSNQNDNLTINLGQPTIIVSNEIIPLTNKQIPANNKIERRKESNRLSSQKSRLEKKQHLDCLHASVKDVLKKHCNNFPLSSLNQKSYLINEPKEFHKALNIFSQEMDNISKTLTKKNSEQIFLINKIKTLTMQNNKLQENINELKINNCKY